MTDASNLAPATPAERIDALLTERLEAGHAFFTAESERLARLCHKMAERFARGGRLLAIGATPGARSDAHHVAVEFVHPVIVGKRALPALALTGAASVDLASEVALLATDEDIVIAFGTEEDGGAGAAGIAAARAAGCLTIAFGPSEAEWLFDPPSQDPSVRQELVETLYHVLWELVHVFFEHRGLLSGRNARRTHDAGASSFLYPFLGEQEGGLEAVLDDVRQSAEMKAEEAGALRAQTLRDNSEALIAAAAALRARLDAGGKLLALGNGGSATDAMDAVADFRQAIAAGAGPGAGVDGAGRGWPALDLSDDSSIITAVANDIGTDAIFSRQVIAYGGEGDVLLALSTSGNSRSVLAALAEGRRRGLETIAMVGYDGGEVATKNLADHIIITSSQHIPRIQEAQASAYHALRALVG